MSLYSLSWSIVSDDVEKSSKGIHVPLWLSKLTAKSQNSNKCRLCALELNDHLSLLTRDVWTHMEGATLKRIAYNKTYSDNSLNVCICLTTWQINITDKSHQWQISFETHPQSTASMLVFTKCTLLTQQNFGLNAECYYSNALTIGTNFFWEY